jgi:hypothetical protein
MPARTSSRAAQLNRRAGDAVRTALALFGLALVLAIGLFLLGTRPFNAPPPNARTGDGEIRIGTIFLAPDDDNFCRQLTFDNTSGQMHDKGSVPCSGAEAGETRDRSERRFNSHIDTVREGFRNR